MVMEQVHDPGGWPSLFFKLSDDNFSGVVSLESKAVIRQFYFYFGDVLACSKASGGDEELSAIYSKRSTVSREIATGLIVEEGRVLVTPREFEGDEFSIGVDRRIDVWRAMLKGVQGSPLLGSVGPSEASRLMLSITQLGRQIVSEAAEGLDVRVSSDALWLLQEITEPITLSRLRTRAGVGENIRGLIWLLGSLGYLEQSVSESSPSVNATTEAPAPKPPISRPPVVDSKKPVTTPVLKLELPEPIIRPDVAPKESIDIGERPSDPVEGLRWEYNARMGFDYYRFLGMDESSSVIDLVKECRGVMQRLHGAQRSNSLPDDVVQMVSELLSALTIVFSTFSDQRRKESYDESLANGDAVPLAKSEIAPSQSTESLASQERARNFSPPARDEEGWSFWKKGKS